MSNEFIKLPEPGKRKKPKTEWTCSECKGKLYIIRGWGSCEPCRRGESVPVGFVRSAGSQKGKEIHLKGMVMKELLQDMDYDEALEDMEEELKEKGYFIIEEFEIE